MILQNAIKSKATNNILVSSYRHDFVDSEKDDNYIAVDGGYDYIKRSGDPDLYEELSLFESDPISVRAEKAVWHSKGTYYLMKELSSDHLKNIAIWLQPKEPENWRLEVITFLLSKRPTV